MSRSIALANRAAGVVGISESRVKRGFNALKLRSCRERCGKGGGGAPPSPATRRQEPNSWLLLASFRLTQCERDHSRRAGLGLVSKLDAAMTESAGFSMERMGLFP